MSLFLHRTWAEINLDNIRHNFDLIKSKLSPETKFMAVVKADAYGHGAKVISHELDILGADWFAVSNIEEAISMAVKAEHGNRHSAHIHSKNVDRLTAFARAVETTIFVKNAPSYAGIGAGGEGHTTFTIAGPTGEGLTSARSFTRQRRCVMADGLHIV